MATDQKRTIIIDGGGQNYLAGRCPPIEVEITVRRKKAAKRVKGTRKAVRKAARKVRKVARKVRKAARKAGRRGGRN